MTSKRRGDGCDSKQQENAMLVTEAGLDEMEEYVLTIARFFFQSYADPESQAWMPGFDLSEAAFGHDIGAVLGMRVVDMLRGVRMSRRSVLMFNSPTCPNCSAYLSEHERRLIFALAAMRMGKTGVAQTELMMLCEGFDTSYTLSALRRLKDMLPKRAKTSLNIDKSRSIA